LIYWIRNDVDLDVGVGWIIGIVDEGIDMDYFISL
jgi:hypothetical protein